MTEGKEKIDANRISNQPEEPVVKPFEQNMLKPKKPIAPFVVIVSITLGIISGILLSGTGTKSLVTSTANKGGDGMSSGGTVVGSTDKETFKDCAKGIIKSNDGKITDEGTHVLTRPGGESQNVFLTSSVVDLDGFLNKEVEICGQTNQAQKAGWLMDAGRVKTL